MPTFKKGVGYVLLGAGATTLVAQPFALADDYTADLPEVPGFSFNATATGTASLSDSAVTRIAISDTILESREYEAQLERYGGAIKIIRTQFDSE